MTKPAAKPPLVSQKTLAPTRKLNAAAVGVAVMAVIQVVTHNLFPSWDQPYLWVGLSPIAVYVAGYFFRDRANVSVDQEK